MSSGITTSCTKLTDLLFKIKDQKQSASDVDSGLVTDIMALFAQLSGQHHKLINQINQSSEESFHWQEKCDEAQEVLDEQLAYIRYMNTEYDGRQWQPKDNVIQILPGDGHPEIKEKLDAELEERKRLCRYYNSLQETVNAARRDAEDTRSELDKVRTVMVTMTTPSFLAGISPCTDMGKAGGNLPGPLFTFHQLMLACIREYNEQDITMAVTTDNPIKGTSLYLGMTSLEVPDATRKLLQPDELLITIRIRGQHYVVLRHHPQIKVVSCDHTFTESCDQLADLVCGDTGLEAPNTSLDFTFKMPNTSELIKCGMLGRLYFWLQELCGLNVIPPRQRPPHTISAVTPHTLIKFLLSL